MKKRFIWLLGLVISFGLVAPATLAAPAQQNSAAQSENGKGRKDDLPNPLGDKQRALRQRGQEMKLKGKLPKDAKVGKVAKGQYVELAREGEDSIWTVLGEFSDVKHNQIAQPDRSVNNTTIWTSDFSQSYYKNLLFNDTSGANSMRNFYKEQSSGRYAVNGDVTDWAQVTKPGAYYGSNANSDAYAWLFVQDSVNAWYAKEKAAGKSDAQIADYLSQFDVWDRYDYDGDGNFNEPDGYIDHFQSIHSGEGEEAGGGTLGSDAIWSHRWYAFYNNIGATGPDSNQLGGIRIGNSNIWIGDYTIEPENGGVGVFSHEFAHDSGLPDEYATSGAENPTGFWTLMSRGSWGNDGNPEDGIGNEPFHMSAWDKFQLGWLNYQAISPGDKKADLKLGPAEFNTKQAQAAIVVLPDKQVTTNIGSPYEGGKFYYSGASDDLNTSMTKPVALPAGSVSLTAKVRYNIEEGYDYAYLSVNGAKVRTSLSNSSVVPEGIDGASSGWVDLTADLSAFAGQTVTLGFGYWTDGGVQGANSSMAAGISLDNITITGQVVDGAEADAGWTYSGGGFRVTTGTEAKGYFNAYIAENRQYLGYDAGLKTGPYNFIGGDWAERFPYQDGLLVWYWDESFSNNNVSNNGGGGLILPVDAHPAPLTWSDGTLMRPSFQIYDATFGVEPSDSITLHKGDAATTVASQPAVRVFDDTKDWGLPTLPKTGTQIRVKSSTPGGFMQIEVTPAR